MVREYRLRRKQQGDRCSKTHRRLTRSTAEALQGSRFSSNGTVERMTRSRASAKRNKQMRYAETGFNLEIDLSRGSIDRVESDLEQTKLHLGGLGTSARILWDRVPPETEAFSEDNLLIFATGLLCGTAAPGCNRTIVSTFSPQTQLLAYSMMGGFWAPELKHAGYDKVILRGKSPELVYLWIHNDKVEIRDASHLRGKGAIETAACIRQELNQPEAQVASIGLAGENKVFYASIE